MTDAENTFIINITKYLKCFVYSIAMKDGFSYVLLSTSDNICMIEVYLLLKNIHNNCIILTIIVQTI